MKTLPITSAVYQRRQRVRNYSRPESPLSLVTPCTAAVRMLRRRLPGWSRADHAKQALASMRLAERAARAWSREVERAALETFGRPWNLTDYRVSGIGSDAFTDARKERLRTLAHRRTDYLTAATLHEKVAGPGAMRTARKVRA